MNNTSGGLREHTRSSHHDRDRDEDDEDREAHLRLGYLPNGDRDTAREQRETSLEVSGKAKTRRACFVFELSSGAAGSLRRVVARKFQLDLFGDEYQKRRTTRARKRSGRERLSPQVFLLLHLLSLAPRDRREETAFPILRRRNTRAMRRRARERRDHSILHSSYHPKAHSGRHQPDASRVCSTKPQPGRRADAVPSFPGTPAVHSNRFVEPSQLAAGFAQNPGGCSRRQAFRSAANLPLARADIAGHRAPRG